MKLTASPIPSLTPSPTNPQLFHSPIPYLSTSPVQYCPYIHTYNTSIHTIVVTDRPLRIRITISSPEHQNTPARRRLPSRLPPRPSPPRETTWAIYMSHQSTPTAQHRPIEAIPSRRSAAAEPDTPRSFESFLLSFLPIN